ncbi:MAG: NUDIX domain-containing protein [Actinomycetota bacterium]
MRPFRFCPQCGSSLSQPDENDKIHCSACGRIWYHNAAPTAGCVIVRDGRALVTVRARDPEKGRCDIPGGFLNHDEDPISGVKREVKEELGLDVEVGARDFVQAVPHRYGDDGDWVLALGFVARSAAGDPEPADDVAEIKWVTADEAEALDFAWPHDRDLVLAALRSDPDPRTGRSDGPS